MKSCKKPRKFKAKPLAVREELLNDDDASDNNDNDASHDDDNGASKSAEGESEDEAEEIQPRKKPPKTKTKATAVHKKDSEGIWLTDLSYVARLFVVSFILFANWQAQKKTKERRQT